MWCDMIGLWEIYYFSQSTQPWLNQPKVVSVLTNKLTNKLHLEEKNKKNKTNIISFRITSTDESFTIRPEGIKNIKIIFI